MRDRSKRIMTILGVMIAMLCAIIYSAQKPLVTASAAPGPSQFYAQHNLVSDGFVPADHINPDVVNAWGLVSGPTTPWWIVDNGTGKSTLYNVATGTFPLSYTSPYFVWAVDPNAVKPAGAQCCWGVAGDVGTITYTTLTKTRTKGTFSITLSPQPGTAARGQLTIANGTFDLGLYHTP